MSEGIDWKAREQRQPYQSIWKLAEDNSNRIDRLEQQLAESERQQQKLQAALDASLAMQQEDEQTMGEMWALLEQCYQVCDYADLPMASILKEWLAAHPAPEGGLEAEDDNE